MRIIKKTLPRLLLACLLPLPAHAALNVINTTPVDATAYSPAYASCSGTFRSIGIIKANKTTPIKQAWVDYFCDEKPCDAEVRMSIDCSGNTVGFVQITKQVGFNTVQSPDVDGYRVRKIDNSTIIIENIEVLPRLLFKGLFG